MKARFFAVLAALAALLPPAPVAEAIRVVSLARDGQVLVSFSLDNGFTDEIREAIRSGLPATITYQVELRRGAALWFDSTLVAMTVTAGARFDNLTRLHQLSRAIDGRGEEPLKTSDEEAVRKWMTQVERLPLCPTNRLEANTEYEVHVRARTRPRTAWFFFWPWDRGAATGHTKFTFIP
jgi:hypothetical protein